MRIPFTKCHGAANDFLLTWLAEAPAGEEFAAIARTICARHTGIGANGWILVDDRPGIRLFNSDGSEPELSGNGTRCAAAFLISEERARDDLTIQTGAGPKTLRLIRRQGVTFEFEMNMGRPRVIDERFQLPLPSGGVDVTILEAGNPQCAVPVENFDFDWRALGAEIEAHPHFPNRTNVSFLKPLDRHTIEARFFERGAGATMSSGTGSTGAAACAMLRGLAESPLRVLTEAGPLDIRDAGDLYLTGPAVLIGSGVYNYHV